MKYALCADIGSTYTKMLAVDLETNQVCARSQAKTTVQSDVGSGFDEAMRLLREQFSGQFDLKLSCSSAYGGLKMIAVGLVSELTADAAKMACLNAGAKLSATYSYRLSDSDCAAIAASAPDIVMLAGGTDGGNSEVILNNAEALAKTAGTFPVIVAGNKSAVDACRKILENAGRRVIVCPNVMPSFGVLNLEPARDAIRALFLEQIIHAKGLDSVAAQLDGDIVPTPSAVLDAVTLLSRGLGDQAGLGSLVAVDIGGATTDVYSCTSEDALYPGALLKGLPQPDIKRTVEGDLGMRWNAQTIVAHVGEKQFCRKYDIDPARLEGTLALYRENPGVLPADSEGEKIDRALAKSAVGLAVSRHSGILEQVYTVLGEQNVQVGKSLCGVRLFIGTGGVLVNAPWTREVLTGGRASADFPQSLMPQQPEFYLDSQYILSAMGLLAGYCPENALAMMKKYILPIGE